MTFSEKISKSPLLQFLIRFLIRFSIEGFRRINLNMLKIEVDKQIDQLLNKQNHDLSDAEGEDED